MRIYIDPMSILNMTLVCEQANDTIQEAAELLNQISSHYDWCCAEKTEIDEWIANIKKRMHILQEHSWGYLSAVKEAMETFEQMENTLVHKFSGMDKVIADVISATRIHGGAGRAHSRISWRKLAELISDGQEKASWVAIRAPLERYEQQTIDSEINICKFEDLNLES